jgi:thiol-disulfide isomerase/thioredoxin
MKKWIQKYGFWILISGVAIFWIYRQWPHNIDIQNIPIEQNDGQIVPLTIAKDSITIVHFYAHWCGPCMRELPEIAEFQDIYQKAGISIICVTDDAFEFVEDFKNRSQLKILRTPSLKDINVFSIPMTYIYNQKGEQVQRIEGPFEWSNPNTLTEILKYKQS